VKAFFVTGTDTGVGKTTVACALIAAARARGLRAQGIKPIETGCDPGTDGVPLPLDAIALERAARDEIDDAARSRRRAPSPRTPDRAATADDRAAPAPWPPNEPTPTGRGAERGTWSPHEATPTGPGPESATWSPHEATPTGPGPESATWSPHEATPTGRSPHEATRTGERREAATRTPGGDASRSDPSTGPAARSRGPTARYNIYRFAAPLAPSVAAELEGAEVALAPILRGVDRLRSLAPDLLLIEGAGGLLVPLTASIDMADLAAALALPLIVVARDGLGTINHTLLTLEAAASRGLEVAAVILSAATPGTSDRDAARNAAEIARRGRVPVIGRMPHIGARAASLQPSAPRGAMPHTSRARSSQTESHAARRETPPGPTHADAARASHSRADPTQPDPAHAGATRAESALADPARDGSSADAPAIPSLAELAAAAEANLDLAILLPDTAW
jgi:dethiobiotin synthetase